MQKLEKLYLYYPQNLVAFQAPFILQKICFRKSSSHFLVSGVLKELANGKQFPS